MEDKMDKRGEQEVLVEEEDDVMLPGFRFHPTDEELIGFYLRRKVEKKPLSIEIIKEIDIYKYDPWDLPKVITAGEKEWYFFCLRGRKYRNSVRPNRVTESGFWKATGIDRPIHCAGSSAGGCIGLKKSLVYYRGSAGKGTKTDWMMHEFRLPSSGGKITTATNSPSMQEAEVWTICRIFRRSVSYKKQPNSHKASTNKQITADSSSITSCFESHNGNICASSGYSNGAHEEMELAADYYQENYYQVNACQYWNSVSQAPLLYPNVVESRSTNEFSRDGNWNELGRVVEFMEDQSFPYGCGYF